MQYQEYIQKRLFKILGIIPAGNEQEEDRLTLINDSRAIVEYNVAEADTWYQGSGNELLNFYTGNYFNGGYWENAIYQRNNRNYFWALAGTERDIKRTHSGMPRNIVDTLVNLCGRPIVVNQDGLVQMLNDLDFWDMYTKQQMPLTLVEGWGAYKIDWEDKEIQVKYYKALDVDFIKKNNKVIGMIFKDYYYAEDKQKYMVCETRYIKGGKLYVLKDVFKISGSSAEHIDNIPNVDLNLTNYEIDKMPCLLAEPCVYFKDFTNSDAFGRSIYTGKFDLFDDLDLCLSQSANTIRMSTPHEYINTDYLERDENGLPIAPSAFDRRYTQYVGGKTAEGDSISKEPVMVTQPKLDALNFQTSAVNIQLQILNGVLSPATMGIDIAKKDNADAQREKEKVTIFTRNAILEKDGRMLKSLFNQMLIVNDYLMGTTIDDKGMPILQYREHEISIKYPEFADDSFENKMSVLGDGFIKGVLSPNMYMDKLYGDSLSQDEYQRELEFLQGEKNKEFEDMSNALGNETDPFVE